jgi:hypothetical protein
VARDHVDDDAAGGRNKKLLGVDELARITRWWCWWAVYGRRMRLPTAAVAAGSLIGGWQLARRTGNRPLGGVVLAAGGVLAGREWARRTSPAVTGALVATYVGAFAASHPLARRIGAWPSVLAVSAVTAAAAWAASDRRS